MSEQTPTPASTTAPNKETVDASPTKEFFISMITRDIDLADTILDLLDNSIDGAAGAIQKAGKAEDPKKYDGYKVTLALSATEFRISDNCGGIAIDVAKKYAFHFGRRADAPATAGHSIGLYGIGMKRAMFKIGRVIEVHSSTATEAFVVPINVTRWAADHDNWDFELERRTPSAPGTTITITEINDRVKEDFADPTFVNNLRNTIARDYSFFLQAGLAIDINEKAVRPYDFALFESADFEPISLSYTDETGVEVEIVAGLSKLPPDDATPDGDAEGRSEVDYYGWFVACNDRIVIAGDKTKRTVWGDDTDNFPGWHSQYNGFMGIVRFSASDPNLLPWTTTKRDVDTALPVYRRAVVRMKDATRPFIKYTNARKTDLEAAKKKEQAAALKSISAIPKRDTMKLPEFPKVARVEVSSIQYSVPKSEIKDVAEALGDRRLSNTEVGRKTFYYFKEREVQK